MTTSRRWYLLFSLLISSVCFAQAAPEFPKGIDGCFVSLNLKTGNYYRINEKQCRERYAPYSTFKIPNSLIGLQTGVVADPDEKWHWDAVMYPAPENAPGGDYVKIWAQDLNMRTALSNSIVWYYRVLATKVGEPRMKQWLRTFRYGNQDISGGLDQFWLGSSLRISPEEQVQFLTMLQRGKIPVSKQNLDLVKASLTKEKTDDFRLIAKTGSSSSGEGWLVGWTESKAGDCTFALHLQAGSFSEMAQHRIQLGREFLRHAGCIP